MTTRGGCVNRCDYCAMLGAVENTEMLALDALDGNAPQVWLVLTTRTETVRMERFYGARRKLMLALRRRWPDCQYAALLEYTTGYGAASGGKRRPHWNILLKGVTEDDLAAIREIVARVWCRAVDALPAGQHVASIRGHAGGLMKYLALHFQKASQRPPAAFAGQRFNCSLGYFDCGSRATARRRARESLRLKRQIHHAERRGLTGSAADVAARRAYCEGRKRVWVLTTDRGARLSNTCHDGRHQALPTDRSRCGSMRAGVFRLSPVAGTSGVAEARRIRARRRAETEAMWAGIQSEGDSVRLFSMFMPALYGPATEGGRRRAERLGVRYYKRPPQS